MSMRKPRRGKKSGFNYIKWSFLIGIITLVVGLASTGSSLPDNFISYKVWKYPVNPVTSNSLPDTSKNNDFKLYKNPVTVISSPTNKSPKLSEQKPEVLQKFVRKVKLPSGADDWIDTGISLRRDQTIGVYSGDCFNIKIEDSEDFLL